VRLAQRIPVRVALDEVPPDFRMIAGRTATVSVRELAEARAARPAQAAKASIPSATQPATAAATSGASQ